MSNFPEELKHIKPFLVRSLEMEQHDRVVSVYCQIYACQLAMKVMEQTQAPAVKEYVLKLLSEIETKKASLPPDVDAKDHFDTFVTQIFVTAD
jgi:vacuolar protein sorting-associated protein VTA1